MVRHPYIDPRLRAFESFSSLFKNPDRDSPFGATASADFSSTTNSKGLAGQMCYEEPLCSVGSERVAIFPTERGLLSEAVVATNVLKEKGLVIAHRLKGKYAEIDLLVEQKSGEQRVLEVKSMVCTDWSSFSIGKNQVIRLSRALMEIMEHRERVVGLDLVLVGPNWEIAWYPDILVELMG